MSLAWPDPIGFVADTIGYGPSTAKSAGGYRTIPVDAKAKGYNKLSVCIHSGYLFRRRTTRE